MRSQPELAQSALPACPADSELSVPLLGARRRISPVPGLREPVLGFGSAAGWRTEESAGTFDTPKLRKMRSSKWPG
jgi:hypothetical protein